MMMRQEIWKNIEDYDGKYQVSNLGRVRSMWRSNQYGKSKTGEHILKQHLNIPEPSGYLRVSLTKDGKTKPYYVHILMCKYFIPIPDHLKHLPIEKLQVNHKDENKLNNFIYVNEDGTVDLEKSNLEWCDSKYNSNYGTGHIRQVQKVSKPIIQMTMDGEIVSIYKSAAEASRKYGYNSGFIRKVANGDKHRHSAYGYKWVNAEEQGNIPAKKMIEILDSLFEDIEDEDK